YGAQTPRAVSGTPKAHARSVCRLAVGPGRSAESLRRCPPVLARRTRLVSLRDIHDRFAELAACQEPGSVRAGRGLGVAVAEHWLLHLPAGPTADQAVAALGDAVDLAVKASTHAA